MRWVEIDMALFFFQLGTCESEVRRTALHQQNSVLPGEGVPQSAFQPEGKGQLLPRQPHCDHLIGIACKQFPLLPSVALPILHRDDRIVQIEGTAVIAVEGAWIAMLSCRTILAFLVAVIRAAISVHLQNKVAQRQKRSRVLAEAPCLEQRLGVIILPVPHKFPHPWKVSRRPAVANGFARA